jgi:hypothetical protein
MCGSEKPIGKRLGMTSRNALCVVPSFTIAPQWKLGWSKVLTMKMNEEMANARKPNENRRAESENAQPLPRHCPPQRNVMMASRR